MNNLTLNDWIFLYWLLGVLVNILVPEWKFEWRKTIANLLIVIVAWVITEYVIPNSPVHPFWRFVYVMISIAVTFNPIEIYKFIVALATGTLKDWLKGLAEKFIKTKDVVKTIETKTVETEKIEIKEKGV